MKTTVIKLLLGTTALAICLTGCGNPINSPRESFSEVTEEEIETISEEGSEMGTEGTSEESAEEEDAMLSAAQEQTVNDAEMQTDEEIQEESSDQDGFTQMAEGEKNAIQPDDAYAAYQVIIDEYLQAFSLDSEEDYYNGYYPDVNETIAHNWYTYMENKSLGYCYYDIDGNGIDELLICIEADRIQMHPIDFYAFDGESARPIFDKYTVSDRSGVTLYTNCMLCMDGSRGADYVEYNLYKLSDDGFTPALIWRYEYNANSNPDSPYYNGYERMSEDEFQDLLAGYEEVEHFDSIIIELTR